MRQFIRLHESVVLQTKDSAGSVAHPGKVRASNFLSTGVMSTSGSSTPNPDYFADTADDGITWQPDVYPHAAAFAR